MSKARRQFLEAGRIVRTHGVRGELVLEPWADSAEFLLGIEELYFDSQGQRPAGLKSSRTHKNRLLIRLCGVDTKEQGEALRSKVLYLDRDQVQLEPGRFFLEDLMGLRAVDGRTGQVYGRIAEVISTPANDVYRIVEESGEGEYLFPAVEHMIKEISIERGVAELLPIPGIFDGGGEDV